MCLFSSISSSISPALTLSFPSLCLYIPIILLFSLALLLIILPRPDWYRSSQHHLCTLIGAVLSQSGLARLSSTLKTAGDKQLCGAPDNVRGKGLKCPWLRVLHHSNHPQKETLLCMRLIRRRVGGVHPIKLFWNRFLSFFHRVSEAGIRIKEAWS